jgi:hypothetical protein
MHTHICRGDILDKPVMHELLTCIHTVIFDVHNMHTHICRGDILDKPVMHELLTAAVCVNVYQV